MNSKESGVRIAIVSPNPLSGGPNGVADFITGIEPYLQRQGTSVRLIGPSQSVMGGVRNIGAHYTLGQAFPVSHDGTRHQMGFSMNKRRAENLLLHQQPDLVVLHQPLEGTLGHTLMSAAPRREDGKRIPAFVGHFHANSENLDWKTRLALEVGRNIRRPRLGEYGWPSGMTPGFARTVLGELDGRIAVSNATARFWSGIDEQSHRYKVIYNGINTEELTLHGPKIEAWNDGKKTILFAGRHDPRKGIGDLLDAYRLLRLGRNDIKLKITGEGKLTKELHKAVREKGLSDVEFVGVLSRNELIKAYRSADVFVSPATGGEGFGRTLAEALSCGTLTVGTDIDGYREVIGSDVTADGRFTSMAEPKNPEDLARRIANMLNLPEEEKLKLSREASEYVSKNFSWPIIAEQTINYYDQVLAEHGKSNPDQWPQRKKKEKRNGILARSGVIFKRF